MINLQIRDLSPKFLNFYDLALKGPSTPEERFELWREHYGFAALPPTPEGQAKARSLLDQAWEKYPSVIDRIRLGYAGMEPNPQSVVDEVTELLDFRESLTITLIAFVGFCEGNAFGMIQDNVPYVCIPVEQDPDERRLVLPHELTHAVHCTTAGLTGGWERSIAEVIFQEGLATQATAQIVPGLSPSSYLDHVPGWYAACEKQHQAILAGVLPYLEDASSETVMRFTMGTGPNGLEREAYYAGWVLIGHLLQQKQTLPALVRVKQQVMPGILSREISKILNGQD
jgi:hypothetical protein